MPVWLSASVVWWSGGVLSPALGARVVARVCDTAALQRIVERQGGWGVPCMFFVFVLGSESARKW
jgi:hypothetical protein